MSSACLAHGTRTDEFLTTLYLVTFVDALVSKRLAEILPNPVSELSSNFVMEKVFLVVG